MQLISGLVLGSLSQLTNYVTNQLIDPFLSWLAFATTLASLANPKLAKTYQALYESFVKATYNLQLPAPTTTYFYLQLPATAYKYPLYIYIYIIYLQLDTNKAPTTTNKNLQPPCSILIPKRKTSEEQSFNYALKSIPKH